jgi:hypothetical protein
VIQLDAIQTAKLIGSFISAEWAFRIWHRLPL